MFYGRRAGKSLGVSSQDALSMVLPAVSVSTGETIEVPENAHLWIEIGFGSGDHLLARIQERPGDFFIGIEVFRNGIAHFVKGLFPKDYARVRLFSGTAETFLPTLPEGCVDGLWILFPDPWPKRRHHKRKILQTSFVNQCARCLKPGGTLVFASDDAQYVAWAEEQLSALFSLTTFPWPEDWPKTRYAEKAIEAGRRCLCVLATKKEML